MQGYFLNQNCVSFCDVGQFDFFELDVRCVECMPAGDGCSAAFCYEWFLLDHYCPSYGFSLCWVAEGCKESFDYEIVDFAWSFIDIFWCYACWINCWVCWVCFFAVVWQEVFFGEQICAVRGVFFLFGKLVEYCCVANCRGELL